MAEFEIGFAPLPLSEMSPLFQAGTWKLPTLIRVEHSFLPKNRANCVPAVFEQDANGCGDELNVCLMDACQISEDICLVEFHLHGAL